MLAYTSAYFPTVSHSEHVWSVFLWPQLLGTLRTSMVQTRRKKKKMQTRADMAGESDKTLELVLEKDI